MVFDQRRRLDGCDDIGRVGGAVCARMHGTRRQNVDHGWLQQWKRRLVVDGWGSVGAGDRFSRLGVQDLGQ